MSIAQQLDDALKAAMRDKDKALVSCIRQLKSKVQEAYNAPGFSGAVDDALYTTTIRSYVKSLQKGMAELEAGGERTQGLRDQYQAEIDYLQRFLPRQLTEAQLEPLIAEAIAQTGAAAPKDAGRVMGIIMKTHRDQVDSGLLKRLIEARLGGG